MDSIMQDGAPFRKLLDDLLENYWGPLYQIVKTHPHLIKTVPGFLIGDLDIALYLGRTHIAIEYFGSELIDEINDEGRLRCRTENFLTRTGNLLEEIIGFRYDSTHGTAIPLQPISEGLFFPTNKGWDKLFELNWNFAAQNVILGFNVACPYPEEGKFSRLINCQFFDANDAGLKVRRVKWMDFIPVQIEDVGAEDVKLSYNVSPLKSLLNHDARYTYPLPDDYKYQSLPKINEFIGVWGDKSNSEPDITRFLARSENQFILKMNFGAVEVFSELICEWQGSSKMSIKPDFFILKANGFADIVEFKLPDVGKVVVGTENREAFAAWLASYVAQTRVYREYFDDPRNREWFENRYGFKVHRPRRWIVVGRRSDFSALVWRDIAHDYIDLELITFDDLVDGVVAQFYQ